MVATAPSQFTSDTSQQVGNTVSDCPDGLYRWVNVCNISLMINLVLSH